MFPSELRLAARMRVRAPWPLPLKLNHSYSACASGDGRKPRFHCHQQYHSFGMTELASSTRNALLSYGRRSRGVMFTRRHHLSSTTRQERKGSGIENKKWECKWASGQDMEPKSAAASHLIVTERSTSALKHAESDFIAGTTNHIPRGNDELSEKRSAFDHESVGLAGTADTSVDTNKVVEMFTGGSPQMQGVPTQQQDAYEDCEHCPRNHSSTRTTYTCS